MPTTPRRAAADAAARANASPVSSGTVAIVVQISKAASSRISPVGCPACPWTRSAALEAPFLTGTDEFAYAPLAHPEISLADGRLLVSISRNTTDLVRLRQDPTVGRPRFAEIARP